MSNLAELAINDSKPPKEPAPRATVNLKVLNHLKNFGGESSPPSIAACGTFSSRLVKAFPWGRSMLRSLSVQRGDPTPEPAAALSELELRSIG
jgi:hypothetical protein